MTRRSRIHRPRPNYGAEGTVCAACHDWWPCETVAPREDDDTPAQADQARP